jgi:DoxX-like family
MNVSRQQLGVTTLRWTLALVVVWQSFQFAVSAAALRQVQHMGLPEWIAPSLGTFEALAAVIFLIPKLGRVGAYCLLATFAFASAVHMLHGEFGIGSLLVYGAAVLVCMDPRPAVAGRSL